MGVWAACSMGQAPISTQATLTCVSCIAALYRLLQCCPFLRREICESTSISVHHYKAWACPLNLFHCLLWKVRVDEKNKLASFPMKYWIKYRHSRSSRYSKGFPSQMFSCCPVEDVAHVLGDDLMASFGRQSEQYNCTSAYNLILLHVHYLYYLKLTEVSSTW